MKTKITTLCIGACFLISSTAFSQLGSSLGQAKNESSFVSSPSKPLNIDGFKRESLDDSGFDLLIKQQQLEQQRLASQTPLEKIETQIKKILGEEMLKYEDFQFGSSPPYLKSLLITDSQKDENGSDVLIGEFSYDNLYSDRNVSSRVVMSGTYPIAAIIKSVFGENKVSMILYKKGKDWYQLFPQAN